MDSTYLADPAEMIQGAQRVEEGSPQVWATTEGREQGGETCAMSSRPASHPRRVLVIDDCPDLRWCVAKILEDAGYVVEQADSGDVGVRRLEASPIDLVVTDLQLPGLSGTEVARAARSIRPGLPVIVMTGCPEALDSEPDAAALVAGILRKPFHTEALLGLIAGLEGTQGVESQFASRHPTDGPGTE